MCGVLHALRRSKEVSSKITIDVSIITADLFTAIDNALDGEKSSYSIIDKATVCAAISLLDYFNMHKLNFAGFKIQKTFAETIDQISKHKTATATTSTVGSEENQLLRRILLFPGEFVVPNFLNRLKGTDLKDCLRSFDILQHAGFGVAHEFKPKSGKSFMVFIKNKTSGFDVHTVKSLAKYNVSSAAYIESFDASLADQSDYKGSKSAIGMLPFFI